MKTFNLAILSGDGIGPEIMAEAQTILEYLKQTGLVDFQIQEALVGGASIRDSGDPITNATLDMVKTADAVLFGAVGDYSFDHLPQSERPEVAILKLRKELELFANIRPIVIFDELIENSNLKKEVLQNVDFIIVRELTGDIYFGEPRGEKKINGVRHGFNTMTYSEPEIERIANVGFKLAEARRRKVTSVDKANVLETMQLWRDVVSRVSESYKDIELQHMYVDNAAMQLINLPAQFDVIVTGNIFGD
ncbi:MAG: 3-isopropylmalate dehydrogenase, partial [Burkholderiaceae bacterium]